MEKRGEIIKMLKDLLVLNMKGSNRACGRELNYL